MRKWPRKSKQTFIICVYLALFILIGVIIYDILVPDATCFDGKKNQKEEEVDCGGPCRPCIKTIKAQDLIIAEEAFVSGSTEEYDVLMQIENPNSQHGSPEFSYRFTLKGANGAVLDEREGISFVLPGEIKYILETNLKAENSTPETVEAKITSIGWQKFTQYREEARLLVSNKRFELVSSGPNYATAFGLIANDSPYDFNTVRVNVILRDQHDIVIAFNSTEINTVLAKENREVLLAWPRRFPRGEDVEQVEIEAEANMYNNNNFVKYHKLKGGDFLRYE